MSLALEAGATPLPAGVRTGTPVFRRISLALFLAGFATFSLLYGVQPLLPLFAADFQVSAAASALPLSLSTCSLAFAIMLAGAMSEGWGRRGLMFASMGLAALLNFVASVSPSWHALLVVRALEGALLGGVPAVAMAYLAEEIDSRGLGRAMGLYVSGTAFGGMVGRVGVSLLTDHVGWRHALGVMSVLDLLSALGFVLLLPPSRRFVRRAGVPMGDHLKVWRSQLRDPSLWRLFGIGCTVMGVFVTIYNYAGFRLMRAPFNLSHTVIGLIFGAYVFGMVASSKGGAMADRLGRRPVLYVGLVFAVVGVLLTLASSLWVVILGVICLTIGFFVSHTVASSWVGRLAGPNKGHAASMYLLAYYLGSSIMGTAGGWFWSHSGWAAVAGFGVAVLLVAAALGRRVQAV